jgi:sterol desaturase/sphingolipid hydroxylase (fatty acid hydroxylase superfamily)
MSYTVGDGMVALALSAGIVGYVYVTHQSRRKRLEMIHQERLAAMEKGIPLPEFPLEPARNPRVPDPNVVPILGIVLLSLSLGAMIALHWILPAPANGLWVAPLPLAFLGVGLLAFHFLKHDVSR